MKKIVLASQSPRRLTLLKQIAYDFDVVIAIDKESTDKTLPWEIVMDLATHKAKSVATKCAPNDLIIGADTIVYLDGKVLGKPKDNEEATQMLKSMSGNIHTVYTGVCILCGGVEDTFFVESKVKFFQLSAEKIQNYVDTGSPLDKAGAYGIQDSGFVEKITGSYSNVMGLPLEELKQHLSHFTED